VLNNIIFSSNKCSPTLYGLAVHHIALLSPPGSWRRLPKPHVLCCRWRLTKACAAHIGGSLNRVLWEGESARCMTRPSLHHLCPFMEPEHMAARRTADKR